MDYGKVGVMCLMLQVSYYKHDTLLHVENKMKQYTCEDETDRTQQRGQGGRT